MVIAWVITLPAAAAIGAITWLIGTGLNNLTNTHYVGELVVFLILLAFSIWMWRHSQKDAVDASNVTADWNDSKNGDTEKTQDETLESRQNNDQDIPELPSPAREKAGA